MDLYQHWLPIAASAGSLRDLGYLVGQAAFYVLLAAVLASLAIWLWRRRG